jgi:ribosomal protein S18 acetylase RimI-like enzyme
MGWLRMFQIKKILLDDLKFAVNLTNTMKWDLVEEDFEYMMKLEPDGCFITFDDLKRIGIATTVSFDKLGWLGNVIVSKNVRGRGVGSLLVKHALEYLVNKRVETIGLYAYIPKVPFYKKLGFKYDSEFVYLKGTVFSLPIKEFTREAVEDDWGNIINLDQLGFGASRKKLLKPILLDKENLCQIAVDDDKILGFIIARRYGKVAEVGPLVCQEHSKDIAVDLLKNILNKLKGCKVSMCIPKKETVILKKLVKWGLSEFFPLARMFYGEYIENNYIYMAESLERG